MRQTKIVYKSLGMGTIMIILDVYPKNSLEGSLNFPDEKLINQIFEVTHIGMTSVIPSTFSKEEGYRVWRETY
jgi:hypothetical protein